LLTRSQVTVISILAGLVILVFMGLVVVALLPGETVFSPAPSPSPTVAPTLTPTFPNFLPTASQITPTPAEPTPTNTRIPTTTPLPTRTPRPTLIISLPSPVVRPSATPTAARLPVPIPTAGPTPTQTRTPQRIYSVSFEADNTSLTLGDCTDIKWQVQGALTLQLDGDPVEPTGRKKVCPETDTTYTLTFQVADSVEIERRQIRITVEEDDSEDNYAPENNDNSEADDD
jgi:hypothetical protein